MALIGSLATAQTSKLADLVTEFEADNWALDRTYIVDESDEYYQRFTKFYSDWQKKMADIDFASLSQQGKVDYILLKSLMSKRSYFLDQDYNAFKEVEEVGNFATEIFPFIKERRRGKKPDSKKLAQTLQDATKTIDSQMESWKAKPFKDWQTADKAAELVVSFQKGLEEAYNFYYGYDPDFTWWVEKPYEKLNKKLNFSEKNNKSRFIKKNGNIVIFTIFDVLCCIFISLNMNIFEIWVDEK